MRSVYWVAEWAEGRGCHQVANGNCHCINVINWREPSRRQFSHSPSHQR